MAYDHALADRLREYLHQHTSHPIEEKELFRGLAFLVDGKMCVNVSGDSLMCRFDPALQPEVAERAGYRPMIMKGKELAGYCYVDAPGYRTKAGFDYWVGLCLDFNARAKASAKAKGRKKQAQRPAG